MGAPRGFGVHSHRLLLRTRRSGQGKRRSALSGNTNGWPYCLGGNLLGIADYAARFGARFASRFGNDRHQRPGSLSMARRHHGKRYTIGIDRSIDRITGRPGTELAGPGQPFYRWADLFRFPKRTDPHRRRYKTQMARAATRLSSPTIPTAREGPARVGR